MKRRQGNNDDVLAKMKRRQEDGREVSREMKRRNQDENDVLYQLILKYVWKKLTCRLTRFSNGRIRRKYFHSTKAVLIVVDYFTRYRKNNQELKCIAKTQGFMNKVL